MPLSLVPESIAFRQSIEHPPFPLLGFPILTYPSPVSGLFCLAIPDSPRRLAPLGLKFGFPDYQCNPAHAPPLEGPQGEKVSPCPVHFAPWKTVWCPVFLPFLQLLRARVRFQYKFFIFLSHGPLPPLFLAVFVPPPPHLKKS